MAWAETGRNRKVSKQTGDAVVSTGASLCCAVGALPVDEKFVAVHAAAIRQKFCNTVHTALHGENRVALIADEVMMVSGFVELVDDTRPGNFRPVNVPLLDF